MLPQNLTDQIKEDLVRHEGYVTEIYLCSEGYPTFGIGHMVTEQDMEYSWPVGTPVTDERILQVFHDDCKVAVEDAELIVDDLYDHPDSVIRVLVNMVFNLGRPRLSKFKRTLEAVNNKEYLMAANEMIDSKWYKQVGRRGAELVDIMKEAKA
jgi:lysozyme